MLFSIDMFIIMVVKELQKEETRCTLLVINLLELISIFIL